MKEQVKTEDEFKSKDDSLNSKRNNSSKKSSRRKGKRKSGRTEKEYEKGARYTDNDVSWYSNNKQILASAANLSYFTPLGASYPLSRMVEGNGDEEHSLTFTQHSEEIPGIMVFDYIHGPATDTSFATDPMDIAANNVYAFVRHANSGAKNYDAPDLMLYLLAMDELYQVFALGVRAYGLMRLYSQTNRYLPRLLVEAAGFDFDDVQGNMANFNHALNVLAAQISAYCVPATLPYFRRHYWLASNVFMDEDVIKPQLYLHRPALYRAYDDFSDPQGGSLRAFKHKYHIDHNVGDSITERNLLTQGSKGYTVSEYLDVVNNMLTFLNGSSDIGIISGDIKKAYGDSNLFTLSPIPTDYVVMPTKNEEALSQISNFMTVPSMGYLGDDATATAIRRFDIKQEVGTETQPPQISYNPYYTTSSAYGALTRVPRVLNMHKNDVTAEETMVASRWLNTMFGEKEDETHYQYYFDSVGSEFGCSITVYSIIRAGSAIAADAAKSVTFSTHVLSNPITNAYVAKLMETFDWHPILYIFLTNPDDASDVIVDDILLDFANYTIVQKQSISNMNQTAILSMFDVPQLGSF